MLLQARLKLLIPRALVFRLLLLWLLMLLLLRPVLLHLLLHACIERCYHCLHVRGLWLLHLRLLHTLQGHHDRLLLLWGQLQQRRLLHLRLLEVCAQPLQGHTATHKRRGGGKGVGRKWERLGAGGAVSGSRVSPRAMSKRGVGHLHG